MNPATSQQSSAIIDETDPQTSLPSLGSRQNCNFVRPYTSVMPVLSDNILVGRFEESVTGLIPAAIRIAPMVWLATFVTLIGEDALNDSVSLADTLVLAGVQFAENW